MVETVFGYFILKKIKTNSALFLGISDTMFCYNLLNYIRCLCFPNYKKKLQKRNFIMAVSDFYALPDT